MSVEVIAHEAAPGNAKLWWLKASVSCGCSLGSQEIWPDFALRTTPSGLIGNMGTAQTSISATVVGWLRSSWKTRSAKNDILTRATFIIPHSAGWQHLSNHISVRFKFGRASCRAHAAARPRR